ncbi:MAG TPA: hypothetical protein VHE81_20935 [Lacipirellulaceae bacterium]|nr:hypothetical protein [Lacipirellulaceae bacterium]
MIAAPACAASTVWDGPPNGDFLADGNWTAGAPHAADSAIFNNDFDDTVVFSGSTVSQDLFLENSVGAITFDVDPSNMGNEYTASRYTIVGAAAGQTNHLILASGALNTGILLVGNVAGADNNDIDVMGTGTILQATGGTGGTAAVRIGSNGGSNSSLTVSNGARVESATQTIVGLQGASNNTLIVSGEGSEYSNAQSISLGDNVAADKPDQTNNQLQVLDGGYATTRELIIGTTSKSPGNTVTVSGPSSRLNVRGGQQSPPTEGGQNNDVGRASSNNRLLIENGGSVDGNAIFLLGRQDTSLNNLLSVQNGSLSGWGIEIRHGEVLISNGTIDINRAFDHLALQYLGGNFLAESADAQIDFRSGTLATVNASVSNGSVFTIGDGGSTRATYRMKRNDETGANGTHAFANGVLLASNGTLSGSGEIVGNVSGVNGATVDVGDTVGVVDVTGAWNNSGLEIDLELGDLSTSLVPGIGFDQLNINGTFTHGGSVTIDVSELARPASAQQVKLVGWSNQAGSSANTIVTFVGGIPLAYAYHNDGLYLTVDAAPPGDYNGDGVVDAADYVIWRKSNNSPANYSTWRSHFGQSVESNLAASNGLAVPETASSTNLLISAIAALVARLMIRKRFRCATGA